MKSFRNHAIFGKGKSKKLARRILVIKEYQKRFENLLNTEALLESNTPIWGVPMDLKQQIMEGREQRIGTNWAKFLGRATRDSIELAVGIIVFLGGLLLVVDLWIK